MFIITPSPTNKNANQKKKVAIKNRAHNVHNPDSKKYRTGFAVYTAPNQGQRGDQLRVTHPHLTHPPTNPVVAHHAYQINKMDPSGARTRLFSKLNPDSARVGDILLVTTRRSVEPFGGVLIAIRRRGIETAILLRGQLTKIGTEMWYKVYSRNVTGIEIIKRAVKRARRARLNYLRQPKHDIGSVDNLVREWKRNKNVFASKGGKRKKTKKMMF